MKHRTIAFMLLFVCLLAIGFLESQDSSKSNAITADEYAVYAAAMDEVVGGARYVVLNSTTPGSNGDLDRALAFPVEDANRITDDLVTDFKRKNRQPHAISQNFPVGVRVSLMSEREHSALFAGCMGQVKCGWKTFYDKYQNAPGITSLSRVGFNHKRDAALIYVGNTRDWEVSVGMYLLLEKTNGKWVVTSRTQGRIS